MVSEVEQLRQNKESEDNLKASGSTSSTGSGLRVPPLETSSSRRQPSSSASCSSESAQDTLTDPKNRDSKSESDIFHSKEKNHGKSSKSSQKTTWFDSETEEAVSDFEKSVEEKIPENVQRVAIDEEVNKSSTATPATKPALPPSPLSTSLISVIVGAMSSFVIS